ncbi:MAG: YceH family protein [Acidobacteriota bacterium]
MELRLNEVEVRVLGSLIEKQLATPDYYPMSLNALTNACNQKSSRDPVVAYDEQTVMKALDSLREKHLTWSFKGADSRVIKYGHTFEKPYDLDTRALAVISVLMLRGPQTPGEIKARTRQLFNFETVEDVEAALDELIRNDTQPLAFRLPLLAGTKEHRYTHLLSGPVDTQSLESALRADHRDSSSALGEKVFALEREVEALRAELSQLREQFLQFKAQFE